MTHKTILLAGNPNVGKSTLFNALTGRNQKIANYPGVTVEKHMGVLTSPQGQQITVVDLPGTYSLNRQSEDEAIAINAICGDHQDFHKPSAVVVVAEATKLNRSLLLCRQIQRYHSQVILVVNMTDELKEFGMSLDTQKLSQILKIPVVPVAARFGQGVDELVREIENVSESPDDVSVNPQKNSDDEKNIEDDFKEIDDVVSQVLQKASKKESGWTPKIDKVLLHPLFGGLIFLSLMLILFQSLFSWSGPIMDFIDGGFGQLADFFGSAVTVPWLSSLLSDGVVAGVGSVVIFVPQIAITFLFIGFLEMSGYMARGAFIIDRFMKLIGLEGRAFIPLVSSFACAIPGILATRSMTHPRQRLITILIAPLMTCSARLPVYTLLIACFVPATSLWGYFTWQGFTLFGLFIAGILAGMVMAFLFNRFLPKASQGGTFFMELPRYRLPSVKVLLRYVWNRTYSFLQTAGTVIFVFSMILWALAYFPRSEHITAQFENQRVKIEQSVVQKEIQEQQMSELDQKEASAHLQNSFMGKMGMAIEPLIRPMGFDWKIGVGVIASFAAREVFVSTMGIVYGLGDVDEESQSLRQRLNSAKKEDGSPAYTLRTALALLIFFAFAAQCMSTVATIKRETNSTAWAFFSFLYMTILAYVASVIIYQGLGFWGWA